MPRPSSPLYTPDHIRSWSSPPDSYVSEARTVSSQYTVPSSPTPHDYDEQQQLDGKIRPRVYGRKHSLARPEQAREREVEIRNDVETEDEMKVEVKVENGVKRENGMKIEVEVEDRVNIKQEDESKPSRVKLEECEVDERRIKLEEKELNERCIKLEEQELDERRIKLEEEQNLVDDKASAPKWRHIKTGPARRNRG